MGELGAKNALQDCHMWMEMTFPLLTMCLLFLWGSDFFSVKGINLEESPHPLVLTEQHAGIHHKIHQEHSVSFLMKKCHVIL